MAAQLTSRTPSSFQHSTTSAAHFASAPPCPRTFGSPPPDPHRRRDHRHRRGSCIRPRCACGSYRSASRRRQILVCRRGKCSCRPEHVLELVEIRRGVGSATRTSTSTFGGSRAGFATAALLLVLLPIGLLAVVVAVVGVAAAGAARERAGSGLPALLQLAQVCVAIDGCVSAMLGTW